MSGLYNMVFGVSPVATALLICLDLNREDIPRFRDCYPVVDPADPSTPLIMVYTRTGGGNRAYYDKPNDENTEGPWNTVLRENQYYLRDEDDQFDATYAKFFFKLPPMLENLKEALLAGARPPPEEAWKEAIAMIGSRKKEPDNA